MSDCSNILSQHRVSSELISRDVLPYKVKYSWTFSNISSSRICKENWKHFQNHWSSLIILISISWLYEGFKFINALLKWAASCQNQQNGMRTQRRIRSAWDPPSLIRVFTVQMKKAWVLSYPMSAQKRLTRLGGCPGWSESSLGAESFCWFCHEVAQMWKFITGKATIWEFWQCWHGGSFITQPDCLETFLFSICHPY